MKHQASLSILALLALLFTACSKHTPTAATPKRTDLGIVTISDGIPIHHDLGGSRACVITPTITKDGSIRLAFVIEETNSVGVVQTLATPVIEGSAAGGPMEVIVGDIDIRISPKIKP